LNVNTIALLTATALAWFAGLTLTTAGVVVFATPDVPVVKVLVKGTTAFPAWSVNPLAVTVYAVLLASRPAGMKLSVVPLLFKLTVPATVVPADDTTTALLPTLGALSGALIVKSMRTLAGTFVAPFSGLTSSTVGPDVLVATPVVKFDPKDDNGCPSTSAIPAVACT
jgi:hypothetical protein